MEISEVIQVVKESNEICENLWYNVKTKDTKYFKIRLFITPEGELRTYEKRRIDKVATVDPTDWVRVRPRLFSKTQQFRTNTTNFLNYITESGLWQEFVEDVRTLTVLSDADVLSIYDQSRKEQCVFLEKHGITHINVQMLRNLLYEQKCLRSVYYGHNNYHIKDELQQALKDKVEFKKEWRVTYDNTIIYDPQEQKAYYSERYRDQKYGNHFYLLDDMHIIFQTSK